jgi:hypothetical protein
MKWAGHVPRVEEMRNACRFFSGKSEERRPLGRHRCRWEDNIRMGLGAVGWENEELIHIAQDRDQQRALVNTVMKLNVRCEAGIFLTLRVRQYEKL